MFAACCSQALSASMWLICDLTKSYLSVLFDLALEMKTIDEFKKDVRKSGIGLDGFARVNAESHPPAVEVSQLDPQTIAARCK